MYDGNIDIVTISTSTGTSGSSSGRSHHGNTTTISMYVNVVVAKKLRNEG